MPGRDQEADDRLVGTDRRRVLRVLGSDRLDADHRRRMAGASRVGRQIDDEPVAHPRRGRQRTAPGSGGGDLLRGRLRLRVPQRPGEDGEVTRQARLEDRRRHRISRRGGVPLPDRPAPPHDHLRRSEHLPAGSREHVGHASEGDGRRGFRHPRRRDGTERQRCGADGRPGRRHRGVRRRADGAGYESAWRTTNVRARFPSRRSYLAPTPASCTSRS